MRAIKSTGTKDEILLAKGLWKLGYRYRKNDKKVFGKPDLTFGKFRIVIFVDSEFFHGKDWETNKLKIGTNKDFWWKKIEGNIKRDKLVNKTLLKDGWIVLRFWSQDVRKNLGYCLDQIGGHLKAGNENVQRG